MQAREIALQGGAKRFELYQTDPSNLSTTTDQRGWTKMVRWCAGLRHVI
jgi:hypothetical protein